jgi:hypothetical protein
MQGPGDYLQTVPEEKWPLHSPVRHLLGAREVLMVATTTTAWLLLAGTLTPLAINLVVIFFYEVLRNS